MQDNSYLSLKDKHLGETAVIFGAGPSLFFDFYKNDNFKYPFNCVVLTVNSGIMFMPWQEGDSNNRYWLSNDSLCMRWGYWNLVQEANATKIVRDSWLKFKDSLDGFLFFSPRPTSEDLINVEDSGLCYCSSIPSSIDLCIQMGCKNILLFGVDHYMQDNKSHAWQFLPKNKWPKGWLTLMTPKKQQEKVFNYYNDMAFKALKNFAEIKKVNIINCNLKSKVTVFPKIDVNEALSTYEIC